MNIIIILLTLWTLTLTGLYIREANKTRVLRQDIEALAKFAEAITSPRNGG